MRAFLTTPRGRSVAGLVVAALFVPVMLGITACLETPIGDPERGWADPRLAGVWLAGDPDLGDYEATVWMLEPFDRRTWLVTWVGFQDGDDEGPATGSGEPAEAEPSATETASPSAPAEGTLGPDDVLRIVGTLTEERAEPAGQLVFKAWLTSIAGRRFLVLEPRVQPGTDEGFVPEFWVAYRVVLRDGHMELTLVDGDVEDLGEVKTRGEAEQIIARHVDDPELYGESATLYRVPRDAWDDVAQALERAGFSQW